MEVALEDLDGKGVVTTIKELETSLLECLTSDEIEEFIKDLERLLSAY